MRGFSWANSLFVSVDPDGETPVEDLTYLNIEYGADLTIVRNLFGGFSLGLNPYVMHDPQENYLLRTGTLIGAEWLLVPFLKIDAGNIGARYEVGAEHQVYELPTERMVSLGRAGNTFDFLRHRLRLFGAWHFPRVDLDGGVTAQSVFNDVKYSSISGNGSVTWRVLDDLSFSAECEVSFRNALVNAPNDLSRLPPLAQFYGGGNFGDVTLWSLVSIQYTFGNSLVLRQDQRWK